MDNDTTNQTQQPKTYPQLAQSLIDNGYIVLPIKKESKTPAIRGWMNPDYKPPVTDFNNCGTAIKTGCGPYPVIGIDIDIMDEKLAKGIQETVSEIAGATIYRIGQYPKLIMLYRLAVGYMKKISSVKFTLGHLEILADGQYLIAEGIHPVTKQEYTWYGGSPQTIPAKDLPPITPEQIYKIIAKFEEKARSIGAEPKTKIIQSEPSGTVVPNVLNVPDVLNIFNAPDAKKPIGLKLNWCRNLLYRFDPSCKRKRWINIGMALHHEFRASPEAFKIWDDWSARSKTKYVTGETAHQWQSFSRMYAKRPITGASLIYYSKKRRGKISSKAPKKPKKQPLNLYCQKAITILQVHSSQKSPWSMRGLLTILQRYLKTGRPTAEKVLKYLLENDLIIDNSNKDCLCQYTLTEKSKQPSLPERKENMYAE